MKINSLQFTSGAEIKVGKQTLDYCVQYYITLIQKVNQLNIYLIVYNLLYS